MLQKITDSRVFVEESWAELQRVTWPDFDQLKNATWVIIAFSMVVAGIIWIMDKASSMLINMILQIFGA
jgi:preprotein translocase SecE subunit